MSGEARLTWGDYLSYKARAGAAEAALKDAEREIKQLRQQLEAREKVAVMLWDAERERERLRRVLEQIEDPSYVGNYASLEVIEIYRKWAAQVLSGEGRGNDGTESRVAPGQRLRGTAVPTPTPSSESTVGSEPAREALQEPSPKGAEAGE